MSNRTETIEKELIDEVVDWDKMLPCALIVYNDDFNTFAGVIETLIKVCKHTPEQAEQCTYIIHYRGKCEVKVGFKDELKPMKDAITERGIKAVISE